MTSQTDFELEESWFHLYSIVSFAFLTVFLVPISKLASTFDEKAKLCKSPFEMLPGIIPVTIFGILHLGLYIPGLFIHINESRPSKDDYYEPINWIVFTAGILIALFPHVYTLNWYSYENQKNMRYSISVKWMGRISTILAPLLMLSAFLLMVSAIILVGLDGRWTACGIYTSYTFILLVVFLYFLFEAIWCANAYRKRSKELGSEEPLEIITSIMVDSEGGLTEEKIEEIRAYKSAKQRKNHSDYERSFSRYNNGDYF